MPKHRKYQDELLGFITEEMNKPQKIRTVSMSELPTCDIPNCEREAHYDSKTKMGPHAYLCENHMREVGRPPTTKLEKQVKLDVKQTDEIPTVTVPLSMDSIVDVKCPHCGESRGVEVDANYTVTCEACDNKYRVVSQI